MNEEKVTVYVTKWLFTEGIQARSVTIHGDQAYDADRSFAIYQKDTEWFYDRADAVAYAEQKRLKRIASLENQLRTLRELSFA